MCGIAGFLVKNKMNYSGNLSEQATRMSAAIMSRGPDDSGVWIDKAAGVALSHARLSIIDLSSAGHQPMESASGRYAIVFNGEIYNHKEIRYSLRDQVSNWRGHSDTETLLNAIEIWGLESTLKRCEGMFALALWDHTKSILMLARDRLGEKPLYYGWQGDGVNKAFLFGSELKALRKHPSFKFNISRDAINLLLRHNCIPAPYSIYKNISKLMPGTILSLSINDTEPKISEYWSLKEVAMKGFDNIHNGGDTEVINGLEQVLMGSVKQQMIADVPLGAFLSGGVDSSLIIALMQQQSTQPVKTFTIGFSEDSYNEAKHAMEVAKYLNTDHAELYLSHQDAINVIPKLPKIYDEPFSDSSQIPTFLVSQLARDHVTVSLSGDAGDELFGGYNRYLLTDQLWGKLSMLPVSMRRGLAGMMTTLSPEVFNNFLGFLPYNRVGEKIHKAASVMESSSIDELYLRLVSHWNNPESIVLNSSEPITQLTSTTSNISRLSPIQKMMLMDTLTYLSDDILTKVDRAAMGVSLETRIPFLNHNVVEYAWRMPMNFKVRNGESKWALRQILYKYIPKEMVERPKMGFGVPIDSWLRGPIREWAEELLDESRLRQEGFFNPEQIRQKWREHLSGKRNWQHQLWDVLMFQAWLEEQ